MRIFCSGIGGIGVSAYAAYQRACGHDVSGSDQHESILLNDLRAQGIPVVLDQSGSAVPLDLDLFVYTLALPEDHPECRRARELGIRSLTYFQALGELTKSFRTTRGEPCRTIAVCGTHGKSSTTAMAAKVLIEAGFDPSVILGTKTADLGGRNWRVPSSPRRSRAPWLVEACEYHRSFLHLSPHIILLTNADGDHFDAFTDLADYQEAFHEFIAKLPLDGVLITHGADSGLEGIVRFAEGRGIRVIDADVFPLPVLQIPGMHMRENAKLVLALAHLLRIPTAQDSLSRYSGSWRRMEVRGETEGGAVVIDDYGHHPLEISATLQALKEAYPSRRLVCVFQPHTHDRTLKLYTDFLRAFRFADLLIIPNVYDTRPVQHGQRVDVAKLVSDIGQSSGIEALDGQSLESTASLLHEHILHENDVLVSMGAGDVWKVSDALLTTRERT